MKTDSALTIDYVEIPPDSQIGLHSQPSWELSYVLVGRGSRLIGNTTSSFVEGDLVLIPPDIQHCWYFSDIYDSNGNIANICISFSCDFLNRLKTLFPQLAEIADNIAGIRDAVSFVGRTSDFLAHQIEKIKDLDDMHRVAAIIDVLVTIGKHISDTKVVGTAVTQDTTLTRMSQIKNYVDCNFARPIGVRSITKHLGMSRSSFSSFFRRNFNKTFIEYLTVYRLAKAHDILTHNTSRQSISNICYSVGFQSVSHFNHMFKRHYGYTPKQVYIASDSTSTTNA